MVVKVAVLIFSLLTFVSPALAREGATLSGERREEMLEKLQGIRDTRRKALAQNLHERMCNLVEVRTANMTRHLATMTDILTRVEARGGDNQAVTDAVAKAKVAIVEAQAAVDALAQADCGLEVSGVDEKLRGEVSAAHRELVAQLKSVHAKMSAARKAVSLAISALGRSLGDD